MLNNISIAKKIYSALVVTGLITLLATLLFVSQDEKKMAEQLIASNVESTAQNYFDSVNTMMLTGTIANRSIVQQKLLQQDGIIEARIIRGPQTVKIYGNGNADQAPTDHFEQQGLSGTKQFRVSKKDNTRVMEFIMPVRASADYRGTNCLGCHQAQENDILGAVKISYDLSKVDSRIHRSVMHATLIQLIITIIGFSTLALIFYRLVIFRLKRLRNNINRVADNLDVSEEIKVHHNDELSAVSKAFNGMMLNFRDSLLTVSEATDKMITSAQEVDDISNISKEAVMTQKAGTDSVAAAINELDASASEIELNSKSAADKSDLADEKASQGQVLAEQTKNGINQFKDQVLTNREMINQLNEKTKNIDDVLNMIIAIAEQTNLLALNAAIEAARAGEQGRGFAVVADEVRSLAQRTQDSIAEIQSTISGLQTDASNAVKSMNEVSSQAEEKAADVEKVSGLLIDISKEIKELDEMNVQIASAAKQQNMAADEINVHVVNIKDIAEQSSEDVTRGKEISEHLLELAYNLNQQVSKFTLKK